ncbi:MAG: hypothetical protein DWQ34_07980 [Planctomycetota bacterium]|nr:MAG: hypothetical protein DWQ29_04490 [Planctomycetota bacterium]REJ94666.1 MAG: hypothetical protein DWQ34_07980 [Planctomycetota bacterium]REK31375.1 MAG: hypothetical protein DWQ41_00560 [Planctomycetota bacterium]REK39098.1 MAG: hypothetical protein DWQ45_02595 [Planctomycetota bacterium]
MTCSGCRNRLIPFGSLLLGAWAAVALPVGNASAQDDDLLKKIPRGANAIAVIQADALLNTELAESEGWKDKQSAAYGSRPVMIPPEAEMVIVAAQLDASNNLAANWQLAAAQLSEAFPMSAIARAEGGYVDTVNDTQVAWTPGDAYFVNLGPQMIGILHPANRQYVSRWTDYTESNNLVQLSPYLRGAMDQADEKTQVVLAIDLGDVVQPHRAQEQLENSDILGRANIDAKSVLPLVSSLKGVTMTIDVSHAISGKLKVDFDESAAPLRPVAKELVLSVLDNFDAHIPDLDSWSGVTQNKSIVLEGDLSTDGLRRVASLLEMPSTTFSDLKGVEPVEPDSPDYAQTSQRYYRSVAALIEDLRKTLDDTRDNHALWMERYGRKVDELPILNVDPELLDWGATVSESFRSMGNVERKSGTRAGVRKSAVYGDYAYSGYDGSGYYESTYQRASQRRNQIKRQEDAKSSEFRFDSWKELEDSQAAIRRSMTEKYGVEF